MLSEPHIMRMANRLTRYLSPEIVIAGVDERDTITKLFDKIHHLFPGWIIMTCPVMHPDMHYITPNGKSIFGEQINTKDTNALLNKVHPADQADLYKCFERLHDFLAMTAPEQHHQYRGVLHYRFQKADGQYIYLHDEKAVLSLSDPGNLYLALIKDITPDKRFEGVKLEIFDSASPGCHITVYRPGSKRARLTRRETDLVSLIKQGLSTKEIAWYLNISHHTVRNTKSKLFEKFKVNNTVELLNAAVGDC